MGSFCLSKRSKELQRPVLGALGGEGESTPRALAVRRDVLCTEPRGGGAARVWGPTTTVLSASQMAWVIEGMRREGREMEQSLKGQNCDKLERDGVARGPQLGHATEMR